MTDVIEKPREAVEGAKLVEWSDGLSVGIQEIDEQHKVLVDLLNKLHAAIVEHHGSEVAQEIVNELAEYTKIHFAVEESLMRILGYPGYEEHKHSHEGLIDELVELRDKLQSHQSSVSFELLHFLKIWLTKHIMEEDQLYAPFFVDKGVMVSYEKPSLMNKIWASFKK